MKPQNCHLIGVPMDCGKRRRGCLMGPDAYRTAGLATALSSLGHHVTDHGNVAPRPFTPQPHRKLVDLEECVAWTDALADRTEQALAAGMPIFMGGDHALAAGTVLGAKRGALAVILFLGLVALGLPLLAGGRGGKRSVLSGRFLGSQDQRKGRTFREAR